MKSTACYAVLFFFCAISVGSACDVRESYVARLGSADHFNSNGQRLGSAAAIIRQDRANFHKFGRRDDEDQSDRFFASAENRNLLERMVAAGESSSSTLAEIVNGTPLIEVRICRSRTGDYVNVTVFR